MKLTSNPQLDGYNMPFEGDKHKGTIVLLPYREDTWRLNATKALDEFYEMVKTISKYEKVFLVISKNISEETINRFTLNNVEHVFLEYDDSWARDNTLIFLTKNGKIRPVDFRFNAWGGIVDGLYDSWENDDKLGQNLANYFNSNFYQLKDFILEGGSIHTNGKGVFLVTEACLLSKGRNPKLTKEEIENNLKTYLNAKKVIWLPHGIVNDETNEHVDNMCCFANENTVLIASTEDKNDLQYDYLMQDLEVLENETDLDGNKFNIVKLPLPKTLYMTKEESLGIINNGSAKPRNTNDRLAGSYINFYQSDKFVILPKFGVEEDKIAYDIIKKVYPNKDVIQIKSREILLAGGNIHCTTMQIPQGEFDNEKC